MTTFPLPFLISPSPLQLLFPSPFSITIQFPSLPSHLPFPSPSSLHLHITHNTSPSPLIIPPPQPLPIFIPIHLLFLINFLRAFLPLLNPHFSLPLRLLFFSLRSPIFLFLFMRDFSSQLQLQYIYNYL